MTKSNNVIDYSSLGPRRSIPILLALIIGVALSFGAFFLGRSLEHDKTKTNFQVSARFRTVHLAEEIESNLHTLTAIGSFYAASKEVDRLKFRTFVEPILSIHPGLQALEWIPRVPDDQRAAYEKAAQQDGLLKFQIVERKSQGIMERAEQREEYFPVYFVEPLKGNEAAVGFDLASNPTRLEALNQSRDTGKMVSTARITLVQETGKQFGFLVFKPVYAQGVSLETVNDRREHLKGFALGVFRIGDIMKSSLDHLGWGDIDVSLYDLDAPEGKRFLHTYHSHQVLETDHYISKEVELSSSDLQYAETIDVAGRTWKILCEAEPTFVSRGKTWLPWGILMGGLLVTFLLTFHLLSLAKRNISILEAYRKLEQETIKRKKLEAEWRQLIDTANAPIFGVDTEGKINEWNQMVARITGYSKSEVSGKDLVEQYITDEYKASIKEVLDNALKGDETDNCHVPLYTKAGERVMILLNATTRRGAKGNIVGVVGVGQDITELDKYQANLEREVDERTKELNCLYGISRLIEKSGSSLDEIFQGTVDLIPPAWHYPEITCARVTLRDHEFKSKDFRESVWTQTSDIILREERIGSVEVFYMEKMPEIDEGPFLKEERSLIDAIAENLGRITGKKWAEEELNQSLLDTENAREKIDGILKSVGDGLIVTDTHNRVILMNRAAEDLLGVRFSEVVDRPIDFAIQEKTLREKVRETLDKKTAGHFFDFEQLGDDPKHPRIMRARTSIIHDREGKESGIVTIVQDVTHEREVDRMKTEFLSTAAHELRTPLTSIQGFSEILLMRENLKPEEKKKFLSYINKQAVGLASIINDLLNISRIESGSGVVLSKEPYDAGDTIRQIIPYFQEQYKKHKFEASLPEKPVELFVDKEKMGQVIKNLLSNAAKYSPDGGVIRVTGEIVDFGIGNLDFGSEETQKSAIRDPKSKMVYQVSVQDQGMGMTPEQIEKVFDKFYRVDASNAAIEGTGLGMTIVKHIIEAHGGKVWVESEYGKGTVVTFTIPT